MLSSLLHYLVGILLAGRERRSDWLVGSGELLIDLRDLGVEGRDDLGIFVAEASRE